VRTPRLVGLDSPHCSSPFHTSTSTTHERTLPLPHNLRCAYTGYPCTAKQKDPQVFSSQTCRLQQRRSQPSTLKLRRKHSQDSNITIMTEQLPFRFLDLPKEIRLLVYEWLCWSSERTVTYHLEADKSNNRGRMIFPGVCILATSKQINSEATATIGPTLASRKRLLESLYRVLDALRASNIQRTGHGLTRIRG
jgi:hypothetical protein